MRILTVHADYIEVEPLSKAIKQAEDIPKSEKRRYDEVLVVFTSVEADDEVAVAKTLAKEVMAVAEQVKTKNILLYPLVHLTSRPSKPDVAIKVLQKADELLKAEGYNAHRAPFGWYKGYTLKCKGHPLSELSRELKAEGDIDKEEVKKEGMKDEEVSKSLKQEAQLKSKFYIYTPDDRLVPVEEYDYGKYENLKKFANYETKKIRVYEQEPPHIRIMKEHALVGYEAGSDPGNFRWYPKGRLIKRLLERAITDYCIDAGAMEVETPLMYDFDHLSLKKYLNRFPARQYVVLSDDKRLFLRFAACFGQFLMAHDMVISYKDLPLKMFELTRYSFRREQAGELAGLKRVRALTMPDMHTLCADIETSKQEFEKQFYLGMRWMESLSLDSEVGFRIQTDFFNQNRAWYNQIVKKWGKPILVEMFDERYAYFITKFEFNFIDNMDKASALTTVQIDVENAGTYDINYIDDKGEKRRPVILHASISGSIERVVYALLENEARKMKEGKKAMLPLWLSPTQLRIIPVSDRHAAFSLRLLKKLESRKVRVDVDDRDETLGKKIREAEKEWIPFLAVVGDREMENGMLSVTNRANGEKKEMKLEELADLIEKENHIYEKLSLPKLLSKRPIL